MYKVTYWGNKAQVYLVYSRQLPPIVFNYGESKLVDIPKDVRLQNCFKIEPIKDIKEFQEKKPVNEFKPKRKRKTRKVGE